MQNEPAFPFVVDTNKDTEWYKGLTKRDLFAAMAMQGLLANPYVIEHFGIDAKDVSGDARIQADALIEELERKT